MKQILLITLGLSVALFADFTKSGNIVIDGTTGLQWQDNAVYSLTWTAAIEHCEDLSLDGHSDWRLPNLSELSSILDDTRYNPSIDNTVFQNTASRHYWPSTTHAGNSRHVWYVDFYNGYQNYYFKTNSSYVRCVRAGQ